MLADSQGTSSVRCWKYLKTKLGRLFPEPHLGALQRVLLAFVKDTLAVVFFGAEQVVDDACEFMGRCGSRLWLAQLARDSPEELAEVVLGVVQGMGTHS